jgi:HAE1 family hydrophobic/amphiphilic exporter-1
LGRSTIRCGCGSIPTLTAFQLAGRRGDAPCRKRAGALGRIGAAPSPQRQQLQLTITTEGRLTRTDEFDNIILRANPDGSVVRVKDVARVDLGPRPRSAIADTMARQQRRSASTSRRAPTRSGGPPGARDHGPVEGAVSRRPRIRCIFDNTVFVTATVAEVVRTLAIAFVLVAVVVFLFLGKLRTT